MLSCARQDGKKIGTLINHSHKNTEESYVGEALHVWAPHLEEGICKGSLMSKEHTWVKSCPPHRGSFRRSTSWSRNSYSTTLQAVVYVVDQAALKPFALPASSCDFEILGLDPQKMLNSTLPRLGTVMRNPTPPPSTVVQRGYRGTAALVEQLRINNNCVKTKAVSSLETLFRDPEQCAAAYKAGAIPLLIDFAVRAQQPLRRHSIKALTRFSAHEGPRRLLLLPPAEHQQQQLLLLLQEQQTICLYLSQPGASKERHQQLKLQLLQIKQQQQELLQQPQKELLLPLLQLLHDTDLETRLSFLQFALNLAARREGAEYLTVNGLLQGVLQRLLPPESSRSSTPEDGTHKHADALDVVADIKAPALQQLFDWSFANDSPICDGAAGAARTSSICNNSQRNKAQGSPQAVPEMHGPLPASAAIKVTAAAAGMCATSDQSTGAGAVTKKAEGRATNMAGAVSFQPSLERPLHHDQQQHLVVAGTHQSTPRSLPAASAVRAAAGCVVADTKNANLSPAAAHAPATENHVASRKAYITQLLRVIALVGGLKVQNQKHVLLSAGLLSRLEALLSLLLCGKQQLLMHCKKASEAVQALTVRKQDCIREFYTEQCNASIVPSYVAEYKAILFGPRKGPPPPPPCAYATERLLALSCLCCCCMPTEAKEQLHQGDEDIPQSLAHLVAAACLLEQEPANLNMALQLATILAMHPSLRQLLRPLLQVHLQQQLTHLGVLVKETTDSKERHLQQQTAAQITVLLSTLQRKGSIAPTTATLPKAAETGGTALVRNEEGGVSSEGEYRH
ncbi:hypothetical protein cyc_05758 [Cyclospora cayetanensis]|uniref:Uncharacterized protein n=1 Tax=Cyclospora cayetanensis TaxID=88456 RepID=A0A1D3D0Z9_9EIME|nr:hypothetical protein cyc_05758 [Cyclospora cayetanensis]